MDTLFIFIGLLIMVIFIVIGSVCASKKSTDLSCSYDEVTKLRMEELKKEKEQKLKEFKSKVERLNNEIFTKYTECEDEKLKKLLYQVYTQEVNNDYDYNEKEWMFNNGNLRTYDEILEHNYRKGVNKEYLSGSYKVKCNLITTVSFLVPFLLGTFCIMYLIGLKVWFIGLLPGMVVGGILGLIGMSIAHRANIDTLEAMGVSECDPQLQFERRELSIGKVGLPLVLLSGFKNIGSGIKKIGNPDSWKKMK